jgi:hypothetical protein
MTSLEAVELETLRQRQQELSGRIGEVRAAERQARDQVEAASAELVRLEKSALAGEKVTDAQRRKAEDALLQAKSIVAAPWPERQSAAAEAAREAGYAVSAYASANADALLSALAEDGTAAAAMVDQAAQAVVDAVTARAQVEQRTFALLSLLGPVRPTDVQRSRSEPLMREAQRLLLEGGERAPDVLSRLGQDAAVMAESL